jgi:hypothetical protein
LHPTTIGTKIAQNAPSWYYCYPPTIERHTKKPMIIENPTLENWYFKAPRLRSKQNHNRIRIAVKKQIVIRY